MRFKSGTSTPSWMYVAIGVIIVIAIGVMGLMVQNGKSTLNPNTHPLNLRSSGGGYTTGSALILHGISQAENTVNSKLILPNPTILGSSFNVIGVDVTDLPSSVNYTASNGASVSWIQWSVTLFVWNQTFVNGTTTNLNILNSGGFAIGENSIAPGANSQAAAQALVAPPTVCHTDSLVTQCTTYAASASGVYITSINGLSVVVSTLGHQATWLDDKRNIWVNVVGPNVPINQILALAGNMTASDAAN